MNGSIKPNRKFDHLYAILRWDADADPNAPIDLRITVKKVVTDVHHAQREVDRLNNLNRERGAYYFLQITRFEEASLEVLPIAPMTADIANTPPRLGQSKPQISSAESSV